VQHRATFNPIIRDSQPFESLGRSFCRTRVGVSVTTRRPGHLLKLGFQLADFSIEGHQLLDVSLAFQVEMLQVLLQMLK
jgi:hypothetical protein